MLLQKHGMSDILQRQPSFHSAPQCAESGLTMQASSGDHPQQPFPTRPQQHDKASLVCLVQPPQSLAFTMEQQDPAGAYTFKQNTLPLKPEQIFSLWSSAHLRSARHIQTEGTGLPMFSSGIGTLRLSRNQRSTFLIKHLNYNAPLNSITVSQGARLHAGLISTTVMHQIMVIH